MANLIFFLFISSLTCIDNDPKDIVPILGIEYPGIKCGKKEPKKPEDCTKYGTDSWMLCCWVSNIKTNRENGECQLLSTKMADIKDIKGEKEFTIGNFSKLYWNCGNDSSFINIKFIIFYLILVFLM